MLARANRVIRADDFRRAVRRGSRASSPHAVFYSVARDDGGPTRFGFIITKAVANSVGRNLLRRRLRSLGREALLGNSPYSTGKDIVIRALPGSVDVSWANLHREIFDGLERSATRR